MKPRYASINSKAIPISYVQHCIARMVKSAGRLEAETKRPPFRRRHVQMPLLNENVWSSIDISLKFVPKGQINNFPALVKIMAWCRPGAKSLSELMMFSLLTHICVSRVNRSSFRVKWQIVIWNGHVRPNRCVPERGSCRSQNVLFSNISKMNMPLILHFVKLYDISFSVFPIRY